ncbi:MAG TPA: entericidin A/B family lipoprotein [Alphaproteobacteria bacterium]|nr:entericidin A/B family lipoprotein [Alphaproteobacteria bacterium]HNS43863.1 entericidin A/B family lipoprotein [Alphaproteobacteria bacterium]
MMTNFRILTISALLISTLALAACNTVRGAGEDLERAGEAIQKSAK